MAATRREKEGRAVAVRGEERSGCAAASWGDERRRDVQRRREEGEWRRAPGGRGIARSDFGWGEADAQSGEGGSEGSARGRGSRGRAVVVLPDD